MQWTLHILCLHSCLCRLGGFAAQFFCKPILKKLDILFKKKKSSLFYGLHRPYSPCIWTFFIFFLQILFFLSSFLLQSLILCLQFGNHLGTHLYSNFRTQAHVQSGHLFLMCYLKDPKVMLADMWDQRAKQKLRTSLKTVFWNKEHKKWRNVSWWANQKPSFCLGNEKEEAKLGLVWREVVPKVIRAAGFSELNENKCLCKPKGLCPWNRSLKHHCRTEGAFEPGRHLPSSTVKTSYYSWSNKYSFIWPLIKDYFN